MGVGRWNRALSMEIPLVLFAGRGNRERPRSICVRVFPKRGKLFSPLSPKSEPGPLHGDPLRYRAFGEMGSEVETDESGLHSRGKISTDYSSQYAVLFSGFFPFFLNSFLYGIEQIKSKKSVPLCLAVPGSRL